MSFEIAGVIHLPPLPGAPRGSPGLERIVARALDDARALQAGGVSRVIIENLGDAPFHPGRLAPHVPAMLAVVGRAVRLECPGISVGINALRNDAAAALGAAVACGGAFIRINVHTGAAWTDQGLIEGRAHDTLRYRAALGAQGVQILADVGVKHAVPAGESDLLRLAVDTHARGLADGLIVTGEGTGLPTDPVMVQRVAEAVSCPVWVGSGVTPHNVKQYDSSAAGAIVGTWFHKDSDLDAPLDGVRIRELTDLC